MTGILLLGTCLLGAVLPGAGSELYLIAAAVLAERPVLVMLVVLAAGAQAVGKLAVYAAAATGARSLGRAGPGLQRMQAAFARSPGRATAIVFGSALTSLPPLYVTTIACGAARHGIVRFGLTVFTARTLRYATVVTLLDSVGTVL